jgi:hypothetical protein
MLISIDVYTLTHLYLRSSLHIYILVINIARICFYSTCLANVTADLNIVDIDTDTNTNINTNTNTHTCTNDNTQLTV